MVRAVVCLCKKYAGWSIPEVDTGSETSRRWPPHLHACAGLDLGLLSRSLVPVGVVTEVGRTICVQQRLTTVFTYARLLVTAKPPGSP